MMNHMTNNKNKIKISVCSRGAKPRKKICTKCDPKERMRHFERESCK